MKNKLTLSVVNPKRVSPETIEALEVLLDMAKEGEIAEIAWACRDWEGGKLYGYSGAAYDDPLGIVGVVCKLQLALTCHDYNPCIGEPMNDG